MATLLDIWEQEFKTKLIALNPRPFGLTDDNITELVGQVRGLFEVNRTTYKDTLKFDKIIRALVSECARDLALDSDDFPELTVDACEDLGSLAKDCAPSVELRSENAEHKTAKEYLNEDINTVLGYDDSTPENLFSNPEMKAHLKSGKSSK